MPGVIRLADRLKQLRVTGWPGASLTQEALSRALGVSVPLISSWEHGKVPPDARLEAYALLFAGPAPGAGADPRIPMPDELSPAERTVYAALRLELLALSGEREDPSRAPNPLRFPPGEAITIVCSELPMRLRARSGYVEVEDPDFVASYKYADLDALIELLPNIQKLNPANSITVGISRELSTDHLTAHLIALGGVDFNQVTEAVLGDLVQVPVRQLFRPTDADTGGFSIAMPDGEQVEHKPRLRRLSETTTLSEDVAHFLRTPNPYNRARTLTFFNGSYSRGSHGVVRALTDPKIQQRNAAYLAERFRGADTYSIVCRVKIVANEVVVPDWTLDDIRLHEWPERES